MASPLVFRRRIGRDLAGGYGWYEEQGAGLGEEFLEAIDESFDSIEAFPEMYAYVRGDVRRMILYYPLLPHHCRTPRLPK